MVFTAEAIRALPEQPLGTRSGVAHRILWSNEESMAGVLTVAAGHHLGSHAHHANHHHIWVLDGSATIMGEELGAGAYVHVPSGVHHDIDATTTGGCTVFYLYVRHA